MSRADKEDEDNVNGVGAVDGKKKEEEELPNAEPLKKPKLKVPGAKKYVMIFLGE